MELYPQKHGTVSLELLRPFYISFYRGTSLMIKSLPLGPCSKNMPGALRWS